MNIFKKAHEITKNTVALFAAKGEKVDYKVTFAQALAELKKGEFVEVSTSLDTLTDEQKAAVIRSVDASAGDDAVFVAAKEAKGTVLNLLALYKKRAANVDACRRVAAKYRERAAQRDLAAVEAEIRSEARAIFAMLRPRLAYEENARFVKVGGTWCVAAEGKRVGDLVVAISSLGITSCIILGRKVKRGVFEIFSSETVENRVITGNFDARIARERKEVRNAVLEMIDAEVDALDEKIRGQAIGRFSDYADFADFVACGNRADDY
jgi:hypothetical protein